ncbi:hotdog domain-containing protein [Limnohabitans sp. Rim8]|uniref:hotdog domain-containing protein n=1 Tax=Limnohabitans sp. Rim8 TaxID=1100718 RepID=UPI0025D99E79|nr:hotdog domain-containing protein [Limnohabitans sp. Rim8]
MSGLADHAAGAAATTALPAGKIAVTVDLHVNFLAPAKGQTLHTNARTLRVGARSAWWPWRLKPTRKRVKLPVRWPMSLCGWWTCHL